MNQERIELFVLKSAVIKRDLEKILEQVGAKPKRPDHAQDPLVKEYIAQFALDNRSIAQTMSEYYGLFYMLENEIRSFIVSILEENVGANWWDTAVPLNVKQAAEKLKERELQQGVTPRSSEWIVYTSFGELGEIIKHNKAIFEGLFENPRGVETVLSRLNTLRGPIAHCGILSEDEVLRLKLSIRDWFRIMGPP